MATPKSSSCCTYPRTFLETLGPTSTACQQMLENIKNLDEEATRLREEYLRDEDDYVNKAVEMLTNKNTTAEDLQTFLDDEKMTEMASRRQTVDELRVQTQKAVVEAYDALDMTIQRLDNDIARLEPQTMLPAGALAAQKTAMKRKNTKKFDRKSVGGDAALGDGSKPEDVPIDPNEPVYCLCQRVSFGQMVGCDHDDCRYEWFHYECVGLTEQPQGKWYCPDCTKNMQED